VETGDLSTVLVVLQVQALIAATESFQIARDICTFADFTQVMKYRIQCIRYCSIRNKVISRGGGGGDYLIIK
jgi:hypothetical protein